MRLTAKSTQTPQPPPIVSDWMPTESVSISDGGRNPTRIKDDASLAVIRYRSKSPLRNLTLGVLVAVAGILTSMPFRRVTQSSPAATSRPNTADVSIHPTPSHTSGALDVAQFDASKSIAAVDGGGSEAIPRSRLAAAPSLGLPAGRSGAVAHRQADSPMATPAMRDFIAQTQPMMATATDSDFPRRATIGGLPPVPALSTNRLDQPLTLGDLMPPPPDRGAVERRLLEHEPKVTGYPTGHGAADLAQSRFTPLDPTQDRSQARTGRSVLHPRRPRRVVTTPPPAPPAVEAGTIGQSEARPSELDLDAPPLLPASATIDFRSSDLPNDQFTQGDRASNRNPYILQP